MNNIDARIWGLVTKLADSKIDLVILRAEELMVTTGKMPERALADALSEFKLV